MRTVRKSVTFDKPFSIEGVDGIQPAGTYVVLTDEEEIQAQSFTGWRRIETMLLVPSLDASSGMEQLVRINQVHLEEALASDRKIN